MLLALSIVTNAQVIKGKVVDATTGNPIARASVYLNGSSKGTTSNTQGEFALYTDETKKSLIVSYVGYLSDTIVNYNNKLLSIKLKPRTNELKEVVIGVSNMTREKQMKIFLTEFIGSRTKDCTISNPGDINFTYHKKTKTLEADVNQPLIIHNKKLGYKITYFLSAFSHSLTELKTSYRGNYVFDEDTSGLAPAEIKKILRARDKAYYGSRMHFIRSVWANDLEKNKFFYVYFNESFKRNWVNFIGNIINNASKDQLLNNTFIETIKPDWYLRKLPYGFIKYNTNDKSNSYQIGEASFVSFQSVNKDEPITDNNYIESNLVWNGKMADQRVSELLPIDFEPSAPF